MRRSSRTAVCRTLNFVAFFVIRRSNEFVEFIDQVTGIHIEGGKNVLSFLKVEQAGLFGSIVEVSVILTVFAEFAVLIGIYSHCDAIIGEILSNVTLIDNSLSNFGTFFIDVLGVDVATFVCALECLNDISERTVGFYSSTFGVGLNDFEREIMSECSDFANVFVFANGADSVFGALVYASSSGDFFISTFVGIRMTLSLDGNFSAFLICNGCIFGSGLPSRASLAVDVVVTFFGAVGILVEFFAKFFSFFFGDPIVSECGNNFCSCLILSVATGAMMILLTCFFASSGFVFYPSFSPIVSECGFNKHSCGDGSNAVFVDFNVSMACHEFSIVADTLYFNFNTGSCLTFEIFLSDLETADRAACFPKTGFGAGSIGYDLENNIVRSEQFDRSIADGAMIISVVCLLRCSR